MGAAADVVEVVMEDAAVAEDADELDKKNSALTSPEYIS